MSTIDPNDVTAVSDTIFNDVRKTYAKLVSDKGLVFAQTALLDACSGVLAMGLINVKGEGRKQVLDIVVEDALDRADDMATLFNAFRAGLEVGRQEAA